MKYLKFLILFFIFALLVGYKNFDFKMKKLTKIEGLKAIEYTKIIESITDIKSNIENSGNIIEYTENFSLSDTGYAFLLDSNFNFKHFPSENLIGTNIQNLNNPIFNQLVSELKSGKESVNARYFNNNLDKGLIFIKLSNNDIFGISFVLDQIVDRNEKLVRIFN